MINPRNVIKEEYEELYGDVKISLKDTELADKENGDVEMTVVGQANVNQWGVGNQVKDDAQATQKTEGPILSSSNYAAKYLNFNNIPLVDTKVVLMLDINVQHEVPHTSPFLTIPVYVIPKRTIINPPKIVTTMSLTTILSLLYLLFPHLQQLTHIPTPTKTKATSTIDVSESETLAFFHQRITNLEKDVKELNIVAHSTLLLLTIKSKVPNYVKEYLGLILDDALHKVLQKHSADIIKEHYVLAEIVERLRHQYQGALYHAFMESILVDEDAMDEGVADKLKKRKHDDTHKDEGPFAGLDGGLKRRKTSNDTEPSKKAKSTETSKGTSKGTSKSQPKSSVKSAQAKETVFEAGDTHETHNQG
nr:hypothetical protein [Tanacetum cinerariifolium]